MYEISAPSFYPLFGVAPHIPAICRSGEPDGNRRPKRRRPQTKAGPCETCGDRIPEGSDFVCMSCHAVAPDKAGRAFRHDMGRLAYDRRYGDPAAKQKAKADADAKKAARSAHRGLTKMDRRSLMADARKGDQPIAEVVAFLATQADAVEPEGRTCRN